MTFCLFYCTKPFVKPLRFPVCHVNFKSLDTIDDCSAMRKSFLDFFDVLKSPERHLSVGSKIIPIASQKTKKIRPFRKKIIFKFYPKFACGIRIQLRTATHVCILIYVRCIAPFILLPLSALKPCFRNSRFLTHLMSNPLALS